MKKKFWLWIMVLIIAIAFVLGGVFWDTLSIYLMPKAKLSEALRNSAADLAERFERSPLRVLADGMDSGGCSTAVLQAETSHEILGEVHYEMTVQSVLAPRVLQANGTVATKDTTLDLSLYMDQNFVAVTSADLLDGEYYGIRFETFPDDIRARGLLTHLIGEQTIEKWEKGIAALQKAMGRSVEIPSVSEEDLKMILAGLHALKCSVSPQDVTIDGHEYPAYEITLQTSGEQISAGLSLLSPELRTGLTKAVPDITQSDAKLYGAFLIYNNRILNVKINISTTSEQTTMELYLGEDPAADDLTASFTDRSGERTNFLISSESADNSIKETIERTKNQNTQTITYEWNTSTGEMLFLLPGETGQIKLTLQASENGFLLSSDHFERIAALILDAEGESTPPVRCSMVVTKGAQISVPSYKNFDKWSVEDLIILLKGLGSLLGFGPET